MTTKIVVIMHTVIAVTIGSRSVILVALINTNLHRGFIMWSITELTLTNKHTHILTREQPTGSLSISCMSPDCVKKSELPACGK